MGNSGGKVTIDPYGYSGGNNVSDPKYDCNAINTMMFDIEQGKNMKFVQGH